MTAADNARIAQHVTQQEGGSYLLRIACDQQCAGVQVREITMHIAAGDCNADDYAGDDYDGDLAVHWSAEGLQNTGGGDMGQLVMRGWQDEVGRVMGKFYWEHAFTEQLQTLLCAAGFSATAANDVSGSEWGMQSEQRASYDAYAIADEVRAAMQAQA